LGGLISHNKSISKTQVPLLGDIPILGQLFSHDVVADRMTELIVMITPHIVLNASDMDFLRDAFQSNLVLDKLN